MNLTPADFLAARILVVDDQQANVELLEQMLAEEGYTDVTTTLDPQQVCALHQRTPFDLILLDLQMPVMDGFEVMQALKRDAADPYLPVIVLTAQPAHKLRALQAGAKDFISKPFDLVEVKTRIRNMIEVRLLHRRLADHNRTLEALVAERTAQLVESEASYRSLVELASDGFWEQDASGRFTKVSGPAMEFLGLAADPAADVDDGSDGWDKAEQARLRELIAARQPFLDFVLRRERQNGPRQAFRVSGEPMFNQECRFVGYRGIGVELLTGVDRDD
jgi:PAS domain S-box-containing protein